MDHSSAVPDSDAPKSERMSGKTMVMPRVALMTPSAAQVLAQHDLDGPHRHGHQQLEGLVAASPRRTAASRGRAPRTR